MTAIDNIPENQNFLSPLNFQFQIKKCPTVSFFVQNINLPGMTLVPPQQGNPFVTIPHPGDHIDFDQLMINFKVDEDLKNYLEIHNWIRELGFPTNYDEYAAIASRPKYTGQGIRSDISLLILNSNHNPTFEVLFKDAFPISISSVIFDTTMPDVQFLEAAATFEYVSYHISAI